jgi:Arc/MetJ family transcription regulator
MAQLSIDMNRFFSPEGMEANLLMCIFRKTIHIMRTNIEIDEKLIEEAMKISGLKTKKAAVEAGLKLIITLKHQEKIKNLRGKLKWVGNLEQMRLDQ